MLEFDEAKHEYRWEGKVVPNVTRVLAPLTEPLYRRLDPEVLARAQAEGTAIHTMADMDAKGSLDVDSLPEWLRGRYNALCRFKEETGEECWASEERLYHEGLGYAGTADRFSLLPKLSKLRGLVNLDIKRSLYAGPAIGLQTAGYSEQWNRKHPKDMRVVHRGSLVLNDNGTYKLTFYEEPDDWTAFLACLTQFKWIKRHRVLHRT